MTTDITALFKSFESVKALVMGDAMLDIYQYGNVSRISPEAPVPIVNLTHTDYKPGGAANVAMNTSALGATTYLCTIIGQDQEGEKLIEMMQKRNINTQNVIQLPNITTTVKNRVIGNNNQMLRIDRENISTYKNDDTSSLISQWEKLIDNNAVDIIIIEDYDKGLLSFDLINKIIKKANQYKIPVAVDPKFENFSNYRNISLFKPNFREFQQGLNDLNIPVSAETLSKASDKLRTTQHIDWLVVTLGEKGLFYNDGQNKKIIPSLKQHISDVSGAGDTVISVAALCYALNTSSKMAAWLSNLAGSLVCKIPGVAPVNKETLLQEALKSKSLNI